MLITAKYSSKCIACGETIKRGDMVYWRKDIGCNHKNCGEDFTIKTKDKTTKKFLTTADKAEFLIFIMPLLYGPLYFYLDKDIAIFSILIPAILAIRFGMRYTGTRIAVKGGSRRATKLDVYGFTILLLIGISYGTTWLIHKAFI
jgi:hypothetical protein